MKFALAAFLVVSMTACGGEQTEAMEQEAKAAEATANELLDQLSAGAEAAADSLGAKTDSIVDEVKEAAH
jgi:hypothetical protein